MREDAFRPRASYLVGKEKAVLSWHVGSHPSELSSLL